MKYVEVILPLPLAGTFIYCVPDVMENAISVYVRVVVPFGKKHYYTGIVAEIYDYKPGKSDNYQEIKEIFALLDEKPVVRAYQLRLWQWISSYYLCSIGEVFRGALPSGLKPESQTIVTINPEYEVEERLKPNEQKILGAFSSHRGLSVSDLERISGLKNVFPLINSLLEKGAIEINESLKQRFKDKMETYVCLAGNIRNEEDLNVVLALLVRAKQQEKLLLDYLILSGVVSVWDGTNAVPVAGTLSALVGNVDELKVKLNGTTPVFVLRKRLLAYSGVRPAVLNVLLKRGIFVAEERAVSRIVSSDISMREVVTLSETQQKAYEDIKKSFETKDIALLYGVASSGKTDIYIRMISDMLTEGRQALYLLPEIAIAAQVTDRLQRVFGSRLLVYHSGFSDNERVEIWNRLLQTDEPIVVLGIRSSIFLPFARLGLIIVDEEHDASYKQQESAPRYHARNVAMMLALEHGGKVLLGSATPSLESYLWALNGKYGMVELNNRYGNGRFPQIEVVNVRDLRRKKRMRDTLFSPLLCEKIQEALSKGEQVILFQNRRGFAPLVVCRTCGDVPHCVNCDVCLTYHKQLHRLVCHYCGYSIPLSSKCPSCGSMELKMQGFGTEKVEEEIRTLFPSAKTARLDTDTARTRNAYRRILNDFEEGETQILIGAQMVSKGFDFENVSVAGMLNVDGLMNIPDFRAYERAFQMILQVSGRTGRRDKRGTVILQTSQSEDHPLLQMARNFDYSGMAQVQLKERFIFRYPPYTRLIMIVLRSRNEDVLDQIADRYSAELKSRFGDCVSNPVYPPVTRVQTLFIRKIMLKMDLSVSVSDTRKVLETVYEEMQHHPLFKQVILHYDVDPQ
ncbi:MAG: primosomal protein N' [Tannerella sp.]|jgi:primosomal protein N' (replication factor Y)|nr:primosomal protein N' [Tannerella sp.]